MTDQPPAKLAIAADHAGFALKSDLIDTMSKSDEVEWTDFGPSSADRVDYPDFAAKVAHEVAAGRFERAVLVCGSGIGMCISANKVAGIRAAVVESEQTARLSRQHNDTNILCLGSRILAAEYARDIVRVWLGTAFEGGRHADRVKKIAALESK